MDEGRGMIEVEMHIKLKFWSFEFKALEFVSNFDIRISDLSHKKFPLRFSRVY